MTKDFEETSLPNNICVIDNDYVSEEKTTYYYKATGKFLLEHTIEDVSNMPLYKYEYNVLKGKAKYLDPKTNNVLYKCKFKTHLTKPNELIISRMKNDKEVNSITCNFSSKFSLKEFKYEIEFFNMATEKNELLEIECSAFYKNCSIYYGKKKENGILICQFSTLKNFYYKANFKIDVIPGVDSLFILMIIIQIYQNIQGRKAAAASN
ncbi:hypothetical protein BCR36DRAFT_584876 [Piromyces finnis]|uniref:Tubby C-terminal domain-containing protein n=1 Tax=Piromyces finnis TaxID=1754191 RepID=A0A1Y1V4Y7_9FUNG|nr:hypothetical protein BCR36DRAFT_584876 [Piromyces finnis]|eukprot:ORX47370.1 hypothetical protein BCR36DRAFT_584876 [Piromyces finnis]